MITDIFLGIITIAVVVLVIYLVKTLITLQKTLKEIHTKVGPITEESLKLLKHSNSLAENIVFKSKSLDPFFYSLSDVGTFVEGMTTSLRKRSIKLFEEEKSSKKKANWIELAALGVLLWHKLKKGDNRE